MLVLLTALLLTSCGGAPASTGPRLELELDGQGDAPIAALIVADERHEGVLGTYCWEFVGGERCADAFGLPAPSSYVEIERGTLLTVEGDFQRLHARLGAPRPLTEEDVGAPGFIELRHPVELDLFDEEASLDLDPGRYVLEVQATWPKGEGMFSFGITITDPQP